MRKYLIAVIAAFTAIAFASVAIAQGPDATMKVSLSPKKAGSKKHPRNSKLKLTIKNNDVHKTLKQLDIQLPKTLVADGKGFTRKGCTESYLKANGPSGKCKKAIVGQGEAEAALGVDQDNPQPLHFEVTAVAVGKNKLDFYLHSTTIQVNVVAPGRLKNSKRGQKLVVKIPREAQQPAPSVYAGLVSLTSTLNAKRGKHKLIASVGCKHHKQKFSATLHFGANPARPAGKATTKASAKCR